MAQVTKHLLGILLLGALVAHAAEQETRRAVDVLAGDDALVRLQVPTELDGRSLEGAHDLRLARIDVATGRLLKPFADVHGCDTAWEQRLEARGVLGGDELTFFLSGELPIAPYVPVLRPQGSNAAWQPVGAPFWVVTHPVARVSPCQASTLSLDQQPVLAAERERTLRATVRLVTDDGRVGQGVVINPWGHVLTAAALVAGAEQVHVSFVTGALGEGHGAERVRYERALAAMPELAVQEHGAPFPEAALAGDRLEVLVPVAREGARGFVGAFAALADRSRGGGAQALRFQHRGVLSAVRHATGGAVRLSPLTASGAVVPALSEPASAQARLRVGPGASKDDQGSPVFDHAGVVWGILLREGEAAWATHAVDRYVQWYHAGLIEQIAARTAGGG